MANRRPSPSMMQMQHHGPSQGPPPPPIQQANAPQGPPHFPPFRQLHQLNELVWIQIGRNMIATLFFIFFLLVLSRMLTIYRANLIGSLAEQLGEHNEAMSAYEHALRANPQSIQAMSAISLILRHKEDFTKAIDFLQAILTIDKTHGETWGNLGTPNTSL